LGGVYVKALMERDNWQMTALRRKVNESKECIRGIKWFTFGGDGCYPMVYKR
jgi:hypothetical protein